MVRSSSLTGVADLDHQHEPVQLGLGQGVGPFLLDRVLGGHHQERIGQRVGRVADGDLTLLHRLQQRGLHLGRGPVDLVGQHQVGEDRAALGHELALGLVVDDRAHDVGRQQIGRELDALKAHRQRVRQGLDGQGLGQAGHPLQQHVATGEQADQDAVDHRLLTDDDLADLGDKLVDEGGLLLDQVVDDANVHGGKDLLRIARPRAAKSPPTTTRSGWIFPERRVEAFSG